MPQKCGLWVTGRWDPGTPGLTLSLPLTEIPAPAAQKLPNHSREHGSSTAVVESIVQGCQNRHALQNWACREARVCRRQPGRGGHPPMKGNLSTPVMSETDKPCVIPRGYGTFPSWPQGQRQCGGCQELRCGRRSLSHRTVSLGH